MRINVPKAFAGIKEHFSPRLIGEVNDQYVKLVKIKGQDVPWHNHEQEDELFYILEGELLMEIEGAPGLLMKKGDLLVVKKGTNHRVSSTALCRVMLIESKSTRHTGNVLSAITKSTEEQLY